MKAVLPCLLGLLVALTSGCGGGPAAGIVTGIVLFNGAPAAGKRIALYGSDARTVTNAAGRYTFTGVQPKTYSVLYQSSGDRPLTEPGYTAPNEVSQWQSASFELAGGGGQEVPPFDVSYNGLLYPDVAMSLIVSATSLVPFHWSTHPQAQRYRLRLKGANDFAWSSEWGKEPTTVFGKVVAPGSYDWQIEIDAGDHGLGLTRSRKVDF